MSHVATPVSIRAVEDRVLQLSKPATNGWALLETVGGNVCNPSMSPSGVLLCSAPQWQAIIKALKARERVGALQIDDSGKWLRLLTGEALTAVAANSTTTSAVASSFQVAVTFAVSFVRGKRVTTLNALAQAVVKRYDSATWARIKNEVINNSKHATPIWHSKAGQVAIDQSHFAKAAPAKPAPTKAAPAEAVPMPTTPVVSAAPASPASPAAPAVRMPAPYVLVNSSETCAAAWAALRRINAAGVDCEGSLDLDANFFLRLVQVGVAFDDGHVCALLFDLSAGAARADIVAALRWLLQSADVVKVFHDLRRDVPALCRELQLQRSTVKALLDTQVLFEVLIESGLAARRYHGARASLNDALRACNLPVNEQKQQFQAAFKGAGEAFWREPQLSADKLRYAADDVRHLVALRDVMLQRLQDGVSSWSSRYAGFFENGEADAHGAEDPFDTLCRLTFAEPVPPALVPRAVATLVTDDAAAAAADHVRMPPVSEEIDASFEPEFEQLLDVLPSSLADHLRERADFATLQHSLAEMIVDAGFPTDLYYRDGRRERLDEHVVAKQELNDLADAWREQNMIGVDNRVTIEDSLHRISVKIDRMGRVDGLTVRVGKHMPGAAALLRDVVAQVALKGKSLLLLGPPGSGKTTLLREIAKELADVYEKRVNVVDTSNEIAGDGERKHPAIGSARRTAVPFDLRSTRNNNDAQAIVMREVIANHTPQVLVVDELCTKAQASAAASSSQRGAALVATAHGRELVDLRRNGELSSLLGGFGSFPVSDAEQARLGSDSKAVATRLGLPVFDIVVELRQVGEYVVHMDATASVDALLAQPGSETPAATVSHRWSTSDGAMWVRFEEFGGSRAAARRTTRRRTGEKRSDRGWLFALQTNTQF
jgi:stage III sporulation protein SpoIIIAA